VFYVKCAPQLKLKTVLVLFHFSFINCVGTISLPAPENYCVEYTPVEIHGLWINLGKAVSRFPHFTHS